MIPATVLMLLLAMFNAALLADLIAYTLKVTSGQPL
jgi:hypothetical protein